MCNLPWSQANNPAFRDFFPKYFCSSCCCTCSDKKLPDESLLRKIYLDKFFEKHIEETYSAVKNEKLWISLDETTDFLGRNVMHFIVRPLHENICSRPYLTACKVLEVVNGHTVSQFVIDCMETIWDNAFAFEANVNNVLVLCTDGAAYMLLAGRKLKCFFPNMKHVTCLAHAIHRISEEIRKQHRNVDSLISNVKKIFLKAPHRIRLFKEVCPNTPLPPEPIITRWGTWLEAASYYATHFNEIRNVLSHLRSSDALAIREAKNLINNENLMSELQFIDENYSVILFSLKELQKSNLNIIDSILAFDIVKVFLESAPDIIKNKVEKVMERNPDLDLIREYSEKLDRDSDINDPDIGMYRFAPLTSTDVERSFSTYKWILQIKRNKLKEENIEKLMIIYFNMSKNDQNTND